MINATAESPSGLRLVVYSVLPPAYQLVTEWVKRHQHRVLLLITTPGPTARRSTSYQGVVAMSPPEQEILITTRMKRTAPIIASLRPDLIVSCTFPYRIPPEVTAIPRLGAVNLHPTPLPAYRGPNPLRMFYDCVPEIGATLHRTEEGFDTGVIYSRQVRPLPDDLSFESIFPVWSGALEAALEEGARRAILGEPGQPQDESRASYGAQFTEEERRLDWNLPARVLQGRVTALTFDGRALAQIEGKPVAVQRLTPLTGLPPAGPPGTVLARTGDTVTLSTADGVVQVSVAEA